MYSEGILELSIEILETRFSRTEVQSILDIIWSMSFQNELRKKIKNRDAIISLIRALTSGEKTIGDEIIKSATGILWNLEKLDENRKSSETYSSQKHIMISYCWEQKVLARMIKNKLVEAGKRVWIDTTNMSGDVFNTMADAVEKASHVICCVSEDYANSRFCQQEIKYACLQRKKLIFVKLSAGYKANSWLGIIMSDSFYYEMDTEEKIDSNFAKLIAFVNGESIPELTVRNDGKNKITKTDQTLATVHGDDVQKWSNNDIMTWFNSIGCSSNDETLGILKKLDGNLLQEFCSWYFRAPEFFMKVAKEELRLNLVDLIKFSNAIKKLAENQKTGLAGQNAADDPKSS